MGADLKKPPNPSAPKTRSEDAESEPILKMAEREDWALFRTVEGLAQKAGVPVKRLRRLVLKELADNGLDNPGAEVWVEQLGADAYVIDDNGPGLDGSPEEIASLFSIRRPMRSSKLLRLPQRGALGNGLRVVAGAVLASDGSLTVTTRGRRIKLRPQADGSTRVIRVTRAKSKTGTRVEIRFGSEIPADAGALSWAETAILFPGIYTGKSSPWWYDVPSFHELILAHGEQPLRALIATLDGCSGGKAGEILSAAGLERAICRNVTRGQATSLLKAAREHARPVTAQRLGQVGRDAFPSYSYAREYGAADNIPFVVEAWACKIGDDNDEINLTTLVNRTPVTNQIEGGRTSKKYINLHGCNLHYYLEDTPKKGSYKIVINLMTPHCPILSDGKAPNFEPFFTEIASALRKATKSAQRAAPKDKRKTQKTVVLNSLDDAIADVSGGGRYRFNERQIYYRIRDTVREETGRPLTIGNFKAIITDYEDERGEIPRMYREPRGSIYHPHRRETISLGTLMVEEYERPIWTFNKLLYIEKEGFSEALKDTGWPERHDCSLISSKGFSTRAARDLVDKLAKHNEPITIFCVHDADAFGTMIYQTFQEATKARGARKIKIVNLGLEPWEAVEADLAVEDVEEMEKYKAVAGYVLARDDGEYWKEWLQTHRVELNAMTTPQFIEWLDAKMEGQVGKLLPPNDVLTAELEVNLEDRVRKTLIEQILREAGLDRQITEALARISRPDADSLAGGIREMYEKSPENEWRNYIGRVADTLTR